jgi:hypothetical protein
MVIKEQRNKVHRVIFAVFWVLLGAVALASGQSYTLDRFTIANGGGTSSGGGYSVSGTIGQPDAGELSGGDYTLRGGFWGGLAAVQTESAPYLTVTRSNNTVLVSWPLPAAGWVLQATDTLPQVNAPWPQINPPYQTNGTSFQFTESLGPGKNKFYRLRKL